MEISSVLSHRSTFVLVVAVSLLSHGSTLVHSSHDLSTVYIISVLMDLQCIGRQPCFESFVSEHGNARLGGISDILFLFQLLVAPLDAISKPYL
jgi:hypothetical protein